MLKVHGKRLRTLAEYAATLLPLEFDSDLVEVNQDGAYTELQNELLTLVQSSPGHYRFLPGHEFSPRLYRGQNRFFTPCRPSLHRLEAVDAMFWATKVFELGALVWQHPAVVELLQWDVEGLAFDLSLDAIAQHSGYPTEFLDFCARRTWRCFSQPVHSTPTQGAMRPRKAVTAFYTPWIWGPYYPIRPDVRRFRWARSKSYRYSLILRKFLQRLC